MEELVLDCVMPYIQDNNDLNSVSLVSKKFFDIDSRTRKHVTVYVHYLPNPSRLSLRFPNLESLKLKCLSCGIPKPVITPWIQEISVKFTRLNSLSIREMTVSPADLKHLGKTRGANIRSLDIRGCYMFSEDGLIDIARYCIDLRSLRLQGNFKEHDYMPNGKWFHELALCNTVMESLYLNYPFQRYDMEDLTRLAKKCSKSLVSLNIYPPRSLSDFKEVFKHAKKLDHFGGGIIDEDWDYSGFKFPSSIRCLGIQHLRKASLPFLLPYLNQLRELDLYYGDLEHECQCFLFERCPNLEVLHTDDPCGDEGLQVIGQFCKKLRKLTYYELATEKGLITLAKGCTNLDYLSVYLLDISNEALECVGTQLKNLRNLCMGMDREHGITHIPLDKGVQAMLMGCNKLEKLDIYLCLTDVGLGYIGKYGHNLRYLTLTDTGESDVGLLELLKGCPKLRELRLTDSPFSEQTISTFVFNINQSLRYVMLNFGSPGPDVLLLTRPLVSTEVLKEVYISLAEKLNRLALQLVADGSSAGSVQITYTSSRARAADDTDTPLVRYMVTKGIRREEQDTLGESSKTPLEIIVRIANVKSRFATAVSEFGDIKLQGRVKDGVPHLTKVGAFEVDVSLEGNIILCRQVNQANIISRVISILGEENVNVNSMSVGRPASRKEAFMVIANEKPSIEALKKIDEMMSIGRPARRKQTVMVIGVDEKPSKEALKKIDKIPAVEEFVFLAL